MERLAQSETYKPAKHEPHDGVTGIAFGIMRMSDLYFYDFDDTDFKDSGWTTQYQAMTKKSNGMWGNSTGWAIPNSNNVYQVQWKITDPTSSFYREGPKIIVNNTLLDKLANLPSGIAKNVALPYLDIYMLLVDGLTAATGKTVIGQIRKDNGAFAGITNAISEVSSGLYTIASGLIKAEMNADKVTLKFTANGCKDTIMIIHTT